MNPQQIREEFQKQICEVLAFVPDVEDHDTEETRVLKAYDTAISSTLQAILKEVEAEKLSEEQNPEEYPITDAHVRGNNNVIGQITTIIKSHLPTNTNEI